MTEFLFKHMANMVTWARIFLTSWMNCLIWFNSGVNSLLVLILAIVIGPTDCLDGWIARKFGIQSKFGGHLDKGADKYYTCSLLAYFAQGEMIDWYLSQITYMFIGLLIGLILCVEAFLIIMWIIGLITKTDTSPSAYGKWKMTFQFIAIAWLLAIKWMESLPEVNVIFSIYLGLIILLILAAICGIFGGFNYYQRRQKEV